MQKSTICIFEITLRLLDMQYRSRKLQGLLWQIRPSRFVSEFKHRIVYEAVQTFKSPGRNELRTKSDQ